MTMILCNYTVIRDARELVSQRMNIKLPARRKLYTPSERKEALLRVSSGRMTQVKAQRKFGVPHRTMHRDAEQLMKNMGFATKEIFHEFCANEANVVWRIVCVIILIVLFWT